MIKRMFKQAIELFDYELRRRSRHFVDDFKDQKKILSKQNVKYIFDIGANIGQTAGKYRRLFPSATIYSFEPTDQAFKILCENLKDCPLVKPQKMAVTNITGYKDFFIYQDSVTNSLFPVDPDADQYLFPSSMETVQRMEVPTITVDDFCLKQKIERIDILKLDIQGGELLALQGAVGLLSKQFIDVIYTEVLFGKLYEKQAHFYEINKFLADYGYALYGIYNLFRVSDGTLGYGDAIFISDNIKHNLSANQVSLGAN